jgi:hypothetical protein
MSEDDEEFRIMSHQARLLQWQKMHESAIHSDRLAGEIGVFLLKIALTINGGALIAPMAAFQQPGLNQEIATLFSIGGKSFFAVCSQLSLQLRAPIFTSPRSPPNFGMICKKNLMPSQNFLGRIKHQKTFQEYSYIYHLSPYMQQFRTPRL